MTAPPVPLVPQGESEPCLRCGLTESSDGDWYRLCGSCRWQADPDGPKTDEEVVVAMLAACEAAISHLWDIAGFFDMDQCQRVRDVIHRLNKLTLPSIRDLQAKPLPSLVPDPEEDTK